MSLWCRVFALSDAQPDPVGLAETVKAIVPTMEVRFDDGELGWQAAQFDLADDATPLFLERFRRDEEGVRGDLQSWAAWLETCDHSPSHLSLMQHVTQTQQVFTLRKPIDFSNEVLLDQVCVAICQMIAGAVDGVYQIDGQGFFEMSGRLLLEEH
jgi:hypothetical protein